MITRLHRLALRLYRRLPPRARQWVIRAIAPKYTVGAMCLIEREDGSLLLVRHVYRRHWGAPGGLLRRGESPDVAARREALEEVGVDVDLLGEPAVVVEAARQRVDVVFRCCLRDPGAVPRPCSVEIGEVGWFPREELPDLQRELTAALVAVARAATAPSTGVEPGAPERVIEAETLGG